MAREWRAVRRAIETATDDIWTHEPDEIRRIRWGVIESGAGSGGQYFSGLVHLEGYVIMLGQHVLYGLLKMAQKPNVDLDLLRTLTRELTTETFNSFEFLADLGLTRMKEIGDAYVDALDDLRSKEEFVDLTGVLLTYVTRMHRWVHFIFPWNLGFAFPQRSPEEIRAMAASLAGGGKSA